MGSDLFVQSENGKTAYYDIIHGTLFKMYDNADVFSQYHPGSLQWPYVFLHVFCIIIDCVNVFLRLPSHNIMAMLLLLATEFRHWIVSYRNVDKVRRYEVTYLICVHGIF
jgi:hypothetical protein